jgi:CRISPR-associated protein Cas1
MPFRLPRLLPALGRRATLPAEEDLPPIEEARLPLHVLAHDAKLSIAQGRLVVTSGEACQRLCLDDLSQVVLHGGARVTVPTLQALARAGVPVVLLSHRGYYLGQMLDLSGATAAVRRAQYRVAEDPRARLGFARDLIGAKLRSAARLARRRAGTKAEVTVALDRAVKAAGAGA